MTRLIVSSLLFVSLVGCADFIGRSQPPGFSSESKTVHVAADDIIRIVTPFSEPRVVTISDADIERSQHVLYVLLEGEDEISMFVTDAENEATSINLTLKPREGGVREINVTSTSTTAIRAASSPSKPAKLPSPKAAKSTSPTPTPWDPSCRLCGANDDRNDDDSRSDEQDHDAAGHDPDGASG